jgi:hypothetical protein
MPPFRALSAPEGATCDAESRVLLPRRRSSVGARRAGPVCLTGMGWGIKAARAGILMHVIRLGWIGMEDRVLHDDPRPNGTTEARLL